MKWLRNYFAYRRLSAARSRAVRVIRRSEKLDRRMAKHQKQLKHLADTIAEDLDEAIDLNRDRDQALEMLENENEVLRDVLVPELTAAQQMAVARWEAEMSIQKYKSVAAMPGSREE